MLLCLSYEDKTQHQQWHFYGLYWGLSLSTSLLVMTIISGKAYNQHSQSEALQFCQKAPISVLILRSLPSLFITLGTTPAILSKITQSSSFSALPSHSILVFLLHLPQPASRCSLLPFSRLISQSTTNPLLISEVMEVVLSLLVLLLHSLCQYSNSSDLIHFFAEKHFKTLVRFLRVCPCCYFSIPCFILFSIFSCSRQCLCDIWTNFSPSPLSMLLFSVHP